MPTMPIPVTSGTGLGGLFTGGGGEMDPLIGQALISGGTALFKGLFGGMGRKAEDKRRWELFMKRMQMIKPAGKYSRGVDPVTEAAIMNMFANRGMQVPQFTGLEDQSREAIDRKKVYPGGR